MASDQYVRRDANNLNVGDSVYEIIDVISEGENPSESCHCSIMASDGTHMKQSGKLKEVQVFTHGLLPGDVVLNKEEAVVESDCHCDYWWTVSRTVRDDMHPVPIGTRVCHRGQEWHRPHMGGTATVTGISGPYGDGDYEYTVMAGVLFASRTGPHNPEERAAQWSSNQVEVMTDGEVQKA